MRVTQAELARRLGKSPATICRLMRPGGILDGLRDDKGKVDLDRAMYRYQTYRRGQVTDDPEGDAAANYQIERAKKEKHTAELARLKAEELSGQLVRREAVSSFMSRSHASAIARLRAMPDRYGAELARIEDEHEIWKRLGEIANEVAELIASDIGGLE